MLSCIGKEFVFIIKRTVMWLVEVSEYVSRNANEVCFSVAMLISLLFYRQYKKYEKEAEREEMVEGFLCE
jgi:hypothetical protein